MRLNTVRKAGTLWDRRAPNKGPLDLHHGKRDLQTMERAMGEIDRIMALTKPSKKSREREQILRDLIFNALKVDSLEAAVKALAVIKRQRVSSSIKTVLDHAKARDKRAAKRRVQEEARKAKEAALARKDDARRKIIVGGTIIAAILDSAPGSLTLLDGLKARLGDAGWRSVESVFTLSDDEKFVAEFLQETAPEPGALAVNGESGKGELVKLYHDVEAKIEKALDLTQTWNGTDQRQQRAADARRKITFGGAVIAAIREGDAIAPSLLQLLDSRIGSTRDREAVRSILPIGEFRPRGRS